MKPIRIVCAAVVPLCVLALSLFWLRGSASAALSGPISETSGAELDVGVASVWPPLHQNLSNSPTKDSGSADIAANEDYIVVVWAEGSSARGLNDGVVMMAWRWVGNPSWHTRFLPRQIDGFAHYQPAVALAGKYAHIVWVREDIEGVGTGNNRISYTQCRLDTGACDDPIGISREESSYSRFAPDVATDADGTPHVVWVRQNHQQIGQIRYNNRKGGAWGTPESVSGGSTACAYTQDNPAIAVDTEHVYVVWDENVQDCYQDGKQGIYFRQRDQLHLASGKGTWRPGGATNAPWGKQLSTVFPGTPGNPADVDGFPSLAAGGGRVYVMWERFAYSDTLSVYSVYTYSLPYRVYTGTTPYTDWWPGGASAASWATMPFTSTSATDTADFYEGLRPAIELYGLVPHVVWHAWDAPSLTALAEIEAMGQLPSEYLVDAQYPYRVSHATYRPGTNAWDLDKAQSRWVSETLVVNGNDRIFASPKLALTSRDGGVTQQLHFALHQRRAYVTGEDSFAWDVWYANNESYYSTYLPFLVQKHP